MTLREFDIIDRFSRKSTCLPSDVVLGIGDDAAITRVPEGNALVSCIDTLVCGVHFPVNTTARDLGYKSLAVNLSDMAAMGADPKTALLSLTLPKADEQWIDDFSSGFFSLADEYRVSLIGGDVSCGPLNVSVVVDGFVPKGQAMRRSAAKVGDLIYVTGNLGDAGLALHCLQQSPDEVDAALLCALNRPVPRVNEGRVLRDTVHAAIDVSDGLVADLERILSASGVGARIAVEALPLSQAMRQYCSLEAAWQYALTAGDDYELCFTVPRKKRDLLEGKMAQFSCGFHCIGDIVTGNELTINDPEGQPITVVKKGYEHFSNG